MHSGESWIHVMFTGTKSSLTCCHFTVPAPLADTWKTSAHNLSKCPSRLLEVCHGESSYRYAFLISGAHEQLNLFPIAAGHWHCPRCHHMSPPNSAPREPHWPRAPLFKDCERWCDDLCLCSRLFQFCALILAASTLPLAPIVKIENKI